MKMLITDIFLPTTQKSNSTTNKNVWVKNSYNTSSSQSRHKSDDLIAGAGGVEPIFLSEDILKHKNQNVIWIERLIIEILQSKGARVIHNTLIPHLNKTH